VFRSQPKYKRKGLLEGFVHKDKRLQWHLLVGEKRFQKGRKKQTQGEKKIRKGNIPGKKPCCPTTKKLKDAITRKKAQQYPGSNEGDNDVWWT